MIIDNLATSLCDYGNIDGRLARALEWLKTADLSALKDGDVVLVDGPRIKALVQEYETIAPDEGSGFEAHRVYIDIQYMVKGREIMQWAPLARMGKITKPYNYEKDGVFFEDPAGFLSLAVEEGDFCVFFPTDGHKPKCMAGERSKVKKIVVKVAV